MKWAGGLLGSLVSLAVMGCGAVLPSAQSVPPGGAPTVAEDSGALNTALASQAMPDSSSQIESGIKQLRGDLPGLVEVPGVQPYLDQLLRRVQAAASQSPMPVKVAVVADASYNVVTDTAGIIHFPLGALSDIDSESELAAWLAHEYGHVMLRHQGGVQSVFSRFIFETAGVVQERVASGGRSAFNGLGAQAVQGVWLNKLRPLWSRTQELDADAFALSTVRRMGFSHAISTKRFLERVRAIEAVAAKQESKMTPSGNDAIKNNSADDDHPSAEQRLEALQMALNSQPKASPRSDSGQDAWQVLRAKPGFKAFVSEAKLMSDMMRTASEGRAWSRATCRQIQALGAEAKMGAVAFAAAIGNCEGGRRQLAALQNVAKRPDAPFNVHLVLASDLLGKQDYAAAMDLVNEALDRYDYPDYALPRVLAFYRRCEAESQGQLADVDSWRIRINMAKLGARCKLFAPDQARECEDAAMSEADRQARVEQNAKTEQEIQRKLTKKFAK